MLFDTASDRYRTIARYDHVLQAHLAAGRLQSEGIDAVVADEHYVSVNWLMANALGGVKIRVPAEQADAALAVLAQLDAGAYALAPDEAADGQAGMPPAARPPTPRSGPAPDESPPAAPGPRCPQCASLRAEPHRTWRWRLAMLLVHTISLPMPFKDDGRWRCADCGWRWRQQA
ncbi:DUF2007 domain-containing protein [Orrella sp. JC864]|uniref:putative signal transducing protein n=1 Tax=Orrella sp. JC864 TaxID=3120298 RepID=UPI0012BD2A19